MKILRDQHNAESRPDTSPVRSEAEGWVSSALNPSLARHSRAGRVCETCAVANAVTTILRRFSISFAFGLEVCAILIWSSVLCSASSPENDDAWRYLKSILYSREEVANWISNKIII